MIIALIVFMLVAIVMFAIGAVYLIKERQKQKTEEVVVLKVEPRYYKNNNDITSKYYGFFKNTICEVIETEIPEDVYKNLKVGDIGNLTRVDTKFIKFVKTSIRRY